MKSLIKKLLTLLANLILIFAIFAFVGCSPTDNLDDGKDNENETPVETVVEITSFDGATIDGEKITMFVEHDIDSVPLSGKVQVSKNCTWKLYSDKLGRNEIPTKVAASSSGELIDGDNQFYILVSSHTEDKIYFYELTIHRSYEVEITYWFNDEIYKTQKVYTGHAATLSDFNVEHYQLNYWQDQDGNKIESPTIWNNINLYANATYLRKTITLEMNLENVGEVEGNGDFYSGDTITLTAIPYLGYDFIGWFDNNNLISNENSAQIIVDNENKNYEARFEVKEEMRNFNFTSSLTYCNIIDVIDKSKTSISVPNYVTNISNGSFSGCCSLESISLPFCGNGDSFYSSSHFGCIFGEQEYPNSIPTPKSNDLSNKVVYYLPKPLKTVSILRGTISFTNCKNLTSISIPNNLEKINDAAFWGCKGLTSITLPSSVTEIGNNVFRGCSNILDIIIPSNVTKIGYYAFSGCKKITTITIPTKTTYIGYRVFYGCDELKSVIVENTKNWVYYRLEAGSFTTRQIISESTLFSPSQAASFFITVGDYTTTKYFCVEE